MLARKLKSIFRKKTGELQYFVENATEMGATYTTPVTGVQLEELSYKLSLLMPLVLGDNALPVELANNLLIFGVAFSERKKDDELLQVVQFTLNYFVRTDPSTGIKETSSWKFPPRDLCDLPQAFQDRIEDLQNFLSKCSSIAFNREPKQMSFWSEEPKPAQHPKLDEEALLGIAQQHIADRKAANS